MFADMGSTSIVQRVGDTRLAAALAPPVLPIVPRVAVMIRPTTTTTSDQTPAALAPLAVPGERIDRARAAA
jgi:hypothetical protein